MTAKEFKNDSTRKSRYLDMLTDEQCDEMQKRMDKYEMKCVPTKLTKEQAGEARRNRQRWENHTTGNAYVLYVQNRTMNHNFRVQGYGKNVFQAARRYYRGLDGKCNWIWKCTQVVAVYECANKRCAQAGKFLFGKEQESAPW